MHRLHYLLLVLAACTPLGAQAHLPRMVVEHTANELMVIETPEVSQALYGELEGAPERFLLNAPQPIDLHLEVLVPAVEAVSRDVSVTLFQAEDGRKEDVIVHLGAQSSEWEPFEEKLLRQPFYRGAVYDEFLSAGEYLIEVRSADHFGKYVLAVGRQERFAAYDAWRTFWLLPELNAYFERSFVFAYLNVFGLAALGLVLLLGLLAAASVILWRWRKRAKEEAQEIHHPWYFG